MFLIRIDAKKLEAKNKGMENIFLAVVSAGPRSKHVFYFCVWLYVFFSIASCLFAIREGACTVRLKLTYSCLGTHLQVHVVHLGLEKLGLLSTSVSKYIHSS